MGRRAIKKKRRTGPPPKLDDVLPKKRPEPKLNRLRELRLRGCVLTQEHMAKVIGLDVTTINSHENGRRAIIQAVAQRYADLLTGGNMALLFMPPGLEPDPTCPHCGQVLPPSLREDVIKPKDLDDEET